MAILPARVVRRARVLSAGRRAVSSASRSRKGVATVAGAPGDAAGELYSRAECAVGAGKAPDPASGGDDAA